jgi:hypothetical protein
MKARSSFINLSIRPPLSKPPFLHSPRSHILIAAAIKRLSLFEFLPKTSNLDIFKISELHEISGTFLVQVVRCHTLNHGVPGPAAVLAPMKNIAKTCII